MLRPNDLQSKTHIVAMDYLIQMFETYLHFRKRQKHATRKVFSHPLEVTGYMYFGNISWLLCMYWWCRQKNLKEIGIIQSLCQSWQGLKNYMHAHARWCSCMQKLFDVHEKTCTQIISHLKLFPSYNTIIKTSIFGFLAIM